MNEELKKGFQEIGVKVPEVLLPKSGIDMTKWAVIACDQYTSQPQYWKDVEDITGSSPSTLNLIFPEVYLEEEGYTGRIDRINKTMKSYLDNKVLTALKPGFVLVERVLPDGNLRRGMLMAIDLERYDYNKGSNSLIRATEATVIERIPPRVRIREGASIELPHVMLLIDDRESTVIEPVFNQKSQLELLYDFELMKNGGHIRGYKADGDTVLSGIMKALQGLCSRDSFAKKYGVTGDKAVLLFAAGDGNHSLASAKAYWESLKESLSPSEAEQHPARYALAEVVNVHDEGLVFHPIHRVLFNAEPESLLKEISSFYGSGTTAAVTVFKDGRNPLKEIPASDGENTKCHVIPFITEGFSGLITVENPPYNLPTGTLQAFLDSYCSRHEDTRIDYIHGEEVVEQLGRKAGNIGFYLPAMDKRELFKTVILEGVLPRKTFSMGEAEEKRYYLECRKIR